MSYFRIVSELNKDDKFFIMFSSAMNLINYTEDNGVPLYYTHEDRVKLLHTLPKYKKKIHLSVNIKDVIKNFFPLIKQRKIGG